MSKENLVQKKRVKKTDKNYEDRPVNIKMIKKQPEISEEVEKPENEKITSGKQLPEENKKKNKDIPIKKEVVRKIKKKHPKKKHYKIDIKLKKDKSAKIRQLTNLEKFEQGIDYLSKNIEDFLDEFPEYLIIDLIMMAVYKIVPSSYTDSYNRNQHSKHVIQNLYKRYEVSMTKIEEIVQEIFSVFHDNFNFDFFNTYRSHYSESQYLEIAYKEFKDIITENITFFLMKFNNSEKIVLWLFDYIIKDFNWVDVSKIKRYGNLIFSIDLEDSTTIDILTRSGIVYFGDYRSSNGNWQNNMSEYYYFWKEIPIVQEFLNEIEEIVPIFKDKLETLLKIFDIEKDKNNIAEFLYLDYLINPKQGEYYLDTYLNKILTNDLTEKILKKDIKNIVKNNFINPLVINDLKNIVQDIKNSLLEKFKWISSFLFNNFNVIEISQYKFKLLLNESSYILLEIFPWYLGDVEFEENKVMCFLFHPNFAFLNEELADYNYIAFGKEERVLVNTYKTIEEIINNLLQEIQNRGYNLTTTIIPSSEDLILETFSKETYYAKSLELENFFSPIKPKKDMLSTLFDDDSLEPKLIFFIGENRNEGIKILEDMIEEEFKYWGLNKIKTFKQLESIERNDNDDLIFETENNIFYDPSYRLISIQITQSSPINLNELLLNAQKSGLRYFMINSQFTINELELEDATNLSYSIIKLPNSYIVFNNFLKIFGRNFPTQDQKNTIPDLSINASWNRFQLDLRNIKNQFSRNIMSNPELISNVPYHSSETDYHYMLKCVLYLNISKILKIENITVEEEIRTSDTNEKKQKIKPDMYFIKDYETIYVEIETCYPSEAEKVQYGANLINPITRLKHKLLKYNQDYQKGNLMLILPNIFCLLHQAQLRTLKSFLFARGIFNKIGIFSIDWSQFPKLKRWN
jgi:hypothetical protein